MRPTLRRLTLTAAALLAPPGPASAAVFDHVAVYRAAADAVVIVSASDGNREQRGSGFVVRADGHVLTAAHVVLDARTGRPLRRVFLRFRPGGRTASLAGRPVPARVVAHDAARDLALLAARLPQPLPVVLPLAGDAPLPPGTPTICIGHPGDGLPWSLFTGVVGGAAVAAGGLPVYQVETAVNPGQSGGPVLDAAGRVVAIQSFVRRVNDAGVPLAGLNYAVRSDAARAFVARLLGGLPEPPPRPPVAEAATSSVPPGGVFPPGDLGRLADVERSADRAFRELRERKARRKPAP